MYEDTQEIENTADIVTKGSGHLQRDNRLKGVAQQRIILQTMDISKDDLSINTIRKIIKDNISKLFILEIPFKIKNADGEKYFRYKKEFVKDLDFGSDLSVVYIKEEIENKKWKCCSGCGQYKLAKELHKNRIRKCRYCGQGYFNYVIKKYDTWQILCSGSKDQVISTLLRKGYLNKAKLNKRLDFFRYHNSIFDVIESKNKEKTGLTIMDVMTTLKYPFLLEMCGYPVKELRFVYNGVMTGGLAKRHLDGELDKYNFKVSMVPVGKYLSDNGVFIDHVDIHKVDNKYVYDVVEGDVKQITFNISAP